MKLKLCCAAILSVLVLTICVLPCFAAEESRQTVRVGYFELGDFYLMDENGNVAGYEADYLAEISKYCNLDFEYVECKDWDDAQQKLQSHEIDLLGTMQRSKEREDIYALSSRSYGITVSELVALPESNYIYEDYAAIGQSVVGCYRDYVRLPEVKALFEKNHISPQIRYYNNQVELLQALENGEVDLIAANSHGIPDSWDVVDKLCYTALYFATWKGNEALAEEISQALTQIQLYDDTFDDDLIKQYFPEVTSSPFTKAEMDYIAANSTQTIYLKDYSKPISWYDADTDTMQGITPDICKLLSEKTGLQLECRPWAEWNSQDEQAMLLSTTDDETPNAVDSLISEPFLNADFYLYHSRNHQYDSSADAVMKIAIPTNRPAVRRYIQKSFPNYQITEYETPEKCLRAISHGDVDCALLNEYVANQYLVTKNIDEIAAIPTTCIPFSFCAEVESPDKEMLVNILNKGLAMIEDGDRSNILLNHYIQIQPENTLGYFVSSNPLLAGAVLVLILLLSVVAAVTFSYARVTAREKKKVESAEKSKSLFFSNISHDMRTPLNGIIGYIDLAADCDRLEESREYLDKAKKSSGILLGLINDTLSISKLDSGKIILKSENLDAEKLLQTIAETVAITAENKGIQLVVNTDRANLKQVICVDKLAMEQIFLNLLNNAIKFTPSGGTVTLDVECLQGLHTAHISVTDTGIGMSREFLPKAFEAYMQDRLGVQDYAQGTGLGLAIVKRYVELLGGRIELQSELGKGTRFDVYLPIKIVGETKDAPEENEKCLCIPEQFSGQHILIAEDHPLNTEIICKLLEKRGLTCDPAENGKIAVEKFKKSEQGYYGLILMDIRMPVMNGLDAARAIRALDHADAKTIPIVAMTANAYEEDRHASREAGMNAHLAKPIDPNVLYETVEKFLCGESRES